MRRARAACAASETRCPVASTAPSCALVAPDSEVMTVSVRLRTRDPVPRQAPLPSRFRLPLVVWLAGVLTLLGAADGERLLAQVVSPSQRLSRDVTQPPPSLPAVLTRDPGAVSSRRPHVAVSGTTSSPAAPTVNVVWAELFDDRWGVVQLAGPCSVGQLDPLWEPNARRLDLPAPTGTVNALAPKVATWDSGHPAVHVVWREVAEGGQRIVATMSPTGGVGGWTTPVALGPTAAFVSAPVICTQDIGGTRHVFVAWTQKDDADDWDERENLRLAISTNGGLSFAPPQTIPTPLGRALLPTVSPGVTPGEVYLAWVDQDDDLTSGGYRVVLQRRDLLGPAGGFHVIASAPLPQALTELWMVTAPSHDGALLLWNADIHVQRSVWYRDGADSVDALPDLVGPGAIPLQGDASLAVDDGAGLVVCVFSRALDAFAAPLLNLSRVLDLSPLPAQPPSWVTAGPAGGLATVSTMNAPGISRTVPQVAIADGEAVAVWMEATPGYAGDFDVFAATATVSATPTWSAPVSVTSKPATLPGTAEARSGSPRLVVAPGRALVVWDDRRDWSLPLPDTHAPSSGARGAPNVHASLVDF